MRRQRVVAVLVVLRAVEPLERVVQLLVPGRRNEPLGIVDVDPAKLPMHKTVKG